jgi:serine-type D-Ala-D-Ala carboxypeptidase/endopeptidase
MNPSKLLSAFRLRLLSRLTAAGSALLAAASTFAQAPAPAPTRDAHYLAKALLASRPGTAVTLVSTRQQVRIAGLRADSAGSVAPLPEPGDVVFEIGSITKVFTGLLLAQAVERGELWAQTSLGELLKGEVNFASADTAAITLQELVTHTSCLPRLPSNLSMWATISPDPYAQYSRKLLWEMLATHRRPGKGPCKIDYSNLGMGLLGDVLAYKLGKSYETLIRERITTPLKMASTAIVLDESLHARFAPAFAGNKPATPWTFDALGGAGAIRSTAKDLHLFTQALVAGRSGPLGAAAERMLKLQHGDLNDGVGYGIFVKGGRYWHNGGSSGFRTMWHFTPDGSDVVVVLSSNGAASPEPIAAAAAKGFDTTPGSGASTGPR